MGVGSSPTRYKRVFSRDVTGRRPAAPRHRRRWRGAAQTSPSAPVAGRLLLCGGGDRSRCVTAAASEPRSRQAVPRGASPRPRARSADARRGCGSARGAAASGGDPASGARVPDGRSVALVLLVGHRSGDLEASPPPPRSADVVADSGEGCRARKQRAIRTGAAAKGRCRRVPPEAVLEGSRRQRTTIPGTNHSGDRSQRLSGDQRRYHVGTPRRAAHRG